MKARTIEKLLVVYRTVVTLVAFIVLIIMVLFLTGCETVPPEPITVGTILTEPAEPKKWCVTVEDLPRCPGRSVRWVDLRTGTCVWSWGCMR